MDYQVLKRIALLLPALRTLHEDRNRFAADLHNMILENERLRKEMTSLRTLSIDKGSKMTNGKVNVGQLTKDVVGEIDSNSGSDSDYVDVEAIGLFLVGHARSGTTIFTEALNSSRDICCLGEANFHMHVEKLDFCEWFNEMHREMGSPWRRSTYLPMLPNANGWQLIRHLARRFKYVGEKVAFRQESLGYDYTSFFQFSLRYFQISTYLCVIRDPWKVAASNVEMFMNGKISEQNIVDVAISQLQTYYLIVCLYLTLPKVFVIIHERISQETFNIIGQILDINLDQAGSYYDHSLSATKLSLSGDISYASWLEKADSFYKRIIDIFSPATLIAGSELSAYYLRRDLYKMLKSMDKLPRGH